MQITPVNMIGWTHEARNEVYRAQPINSDIVVVFKETTYYASVSDPITSQRKKPYGVIVRAVTQYGQRRSSNPVFYKTEEAAMKAAQDMCAKIFA